jgi:hypothetical protein
MTSLEQAVRIAWLGWGGYAKFTICARCGEPRHCRSRGGRRFLCLECFDRR